MPRAFIGHTLSFAVVCLSLNRKPSICRPVWRRRLVPSATQFRVVQLDPSGLPRHRANPFRRSVRCAEVDIENLEGARAVIKQDGELLAIVFGA